MTLLIPENEALLFSDTTISELLVFLSVLRSHDREFMSTRETALSIMAFVGAKLARMTWPPVKTESAALSTYVNDNLSEIAIYTEKILNEERIVAWFEAEGLK